MKVPKGSTVFRFYKNFDGSLEIMFESGEPQDYIWTTWENSNWKSIDWIMGNKQKEENVQITTKEIVKKYLEEKRFDGLVNEDIPCGCPVDNLFICDGNCDSMDCQPAYKKDCDQKDDSCCDCDYPENGCYTTTKPKEIKSNG